MTCHTVQRKIKKDRTSMPGLLESSELVSNSKAVSQCSGWSPICQHGLFSRPLRGKQTLSLITKVFQPRRKGKCTMLEQGWWRSCAVMSGLRVSAPPYVIQVSSIYMHLQVSLVHWDRWRKNRVWQNLWSRCGRQSTTEQYESTLYVSYWGPDNSSSFMGSGAYSAKPCTVVKHWNIGRIGEHHWQFPPGAAPFATPVVSVAKGSPELFA